MLPCPRCQRHLMPAATRCPFCGTEQRSIVGGPRLAIVMGVALTGCGAAVGSGATDEGSSSSAAPSTGSDTGAPVTATLPGTTSSSSTSGSATGVPTSGTSSTGPTETETVGSTTTGESDDDCDTCGGFYGGVPPDIRPEECDVWTQDCPRGEKCMPWANDGGSVHNATRCTPLDADPDQVGSPCTVEGSGVSGVDSCALGAVCYGVDALTNVGECVEQCLGTPETPVCNVGQCAVFNENVLALCLPSCDPLLDDCPDQLSCHYVFDEALCIAPTADGQIGDACDLPGDCVAGSMCVAAAGVPDCMGAGGCCAEVCDVTVDPTTCAEGLGCAQPVAGGDDGVCVLPN